jgi:hypothetical protein
VAQTVLVCLQTVGLAYRLGPCRPDLSVSIHVRVGSHGLSNVNVRLNVRSREGEARQVERCVGYPGTVECRCV